MSDVENSPNTPLPGSAAEGPGEEGAELRTDGTADSVADGAATPTGTRGPGAAEPDAAEPDADPDAAAGADFVADLLAKPGPGTRSGEDLDCEAADSSGLDA